ncbi:MAG: hypothetical protein JRJ50_02555 [Deltaproteobacteria bacterium]|nr:hypothetical protein [Deltaproteobacteria bacterium]MBW2034260.1 hypothetical protein [Deltaproteobacteria bacterium]MBW2357379.1 hypothetical protein [Deltaproteobacteria bacterium]
MNVLDRITEADILATISNSPGDLWIPIFYHVSFGHYIAHFGMSIPSGYGQFDNALSTDQIQLTISPVIAAAIPSKNDYGFEV